MGFIKYGVSLIMLTMFAFAVISFSVGFGSDNNAAVLVSDDPDLVSLRTGIQSDISSYINQVNSSSKTFMETTQEAGDQSASSGGQFKAGVGNSVSASTRIITAGWKKIFGSDNSFGIVLSALTGIILFMAIMYSYKAWIGRNPD